MTGEEKSVLAPCQYLTVAAPESSIEASLRERYHGAGTLAPDRRGPDCLSLMLLLNGSEPQWSSL